MQQIHSSVTGECCQSQLHLTEQYAHGNGQHAAGQQAHCACFFASFEGLRGLSEIASSSSRSAAVSRARFWSAVSAHKQCQSLTDNVVSLRVPVPLPDLVSRRVVVDGPCGVDRGAGGGSSSPGSRSRPSWSHLLQQSLDAGHTITSTSSYCAFFGTRVSLVPQ